MLRNSFYFLTAIKNVEVVRSNVHPPNTLFLRVLNKKFQSENLRARASIF